MPREPFSDEEKHEADMLAEDFTGKPVNYGSTAQAIANLEKRVAYLKAEKAKLLATLENPTASIPTELITTLNADLRQAEADLASYRKQQEGRN